MNLTSNLGLQKPDGSDTFDIETFNSNMDILDQIWKIIYPIGAIYMSANNTSPEELFGGTWIEWGSGRVPVGVSSSETEFATVEKTGGEKTHKLTKSEMPKHAHGMTQDYDQGGAITPSTGGYLKQRWVATSGACGTVSETYGSIWNAGANGGDAAHNNLQPYITCYMWKRTA